MDSRENIADACERATLPGGHEPEPRQPRAIPLESADAARVRVLGGPPESATLKSGLVTLAPGESVGRHSTRENEELIFVLAGRGELRVDGAPAVRIAPESAAYCPPRTEHDVANIGDGPLRYLYVVARARP